MVSFFSVPANFYCIVFAPTGHKPLPAISNVFPLLSEPPYIFSMPLLIIYQAFRFALA